MGKHCCVVGCRCNSTKCGGLSFHKLPRKGENAEINTWRSKLISKIDRIDKGFKTEQAVICSRHFNNEDFVYPYGDQGLKRLRIGALPSKFIPEKSIVTRKPSPRKAPMERTCLAVQRVYYYDLKDVATAITKISLDGWVLKEVGEEFCCLGKYVDHVVTLQITVFKDLTTKIHFKGKECEHSYSAETQGLKFIASSLDKTMICGGIPSGDGQCNVQSSLFCKEVHSFYENEQLVTREIFRSVKCSILLEKEEMCQHCNNVSKQLKKAAARALLKESSVVHPNCKLQTLSRCQLISEVRKSRAEAKQLAKKLKAREKKFNDNSMHDAIASIFFDSEFEDSL